MSMSDELERLDKLHKDGTLSDDEFARAKQKLLSQENEIRPAPVPDQRTGPAANQDFVFPLVMILVVVLLLVVFLVGFGPHWHHWHWGH